MSTSSGWLFITLALAVASSGECFSARGSALWQRQHRFFRSRGTVAGLAALPLLPCRQGSCSRAFAVAARAKKAAPEETEPSGAAAGRQARPKARIKRLEEAEYPLFQSPPPPTENKTEDEMWEEIERSVNRWQWMNVTEYWLNVTSNMPAPKPIPKRLLKDIPARFHSWVGHWYGEDMYPLLAKAATATKPIDITLTNNQAYFDFMKNNFTTVTLTSTRGKKVRLRLPDPSPHVGSNKFHYYQGGYVPGSEDDPNRLPPETVEQIYKLFFPEFPPLLVTAVTGWNETMFKWVNRYFDMIKHSLGDRNVTLCHRVLVNVPAADPVLAMWAQLVNADVLIDGPALMKANAFTEEKVFHPEYVADVLERLRVACILDDHSICPIDEWEETFTFTPSPADHYEGDDEPPPPPPPPPDRPYIPGYDFEPPDI